MCDFGKGRVGVYGRDGVLERHLGSLGDGEGQFRRPWGVSVRPGGDIVYVTDFGLDRVVVYRRSGEYVNGFGGLDDAAGEPVGLSDPWGICVHGGEVYVCDRGNDRVCVYGEDGAFLRVLWRLVQEEAGYAFFRELKGICVSPVDGSIVIITTLYEHGESVDGKGRVHVLSKEGEVLRTFGEGILTCPLGLSVSAGGDIVVADWKESKVVIFSCEGEVLQEVGGLAGPRDVALRSDGRLLVACSRRVEVLRPEAV